MSDTDPGPDAPAAPPDIPTEDDTLTGGDDGDSFDLERFEIRLAAGKYDGHEVAMAGLLHDRAMAFGTRRWRCEFQGRTFTEDEVSGEVAEAAEGYAWPMGWGMVTVLLGDNVRANIKPARAVLYGICRAELGMDDRTARAELKKMTAPQVMGCFDWYQVESLGKDGPPASP